MCWNFFFILPSHKQNNLRLINSSHSIMAIAHYNDFHKVFSNKNWFSDYIFMHVVLCKTG